MSKTITGYRIVVTEAHMMDELGTGYALSPWGQNTDRYKGGSEPVQIEIPDDTEVAEAKSGELLLYRPGDIAGHTVTEAISVGWAKVLGD